MNKVKAYFSKTDQGPYLQVNEDEVDVDLVNNLYVLYDGLGGHGIGDRAAREAKKVIRNFYGRVGGDPDSTMPFFYSPRYLIEGNSLINSFHYAHSEVKKLNLDCDLSQMAAVSALGVCLSEGVATLVSSGNILALLYRQGHLNTLIAPDNAHYLGKDDYFGHFLSYPQSALGLFDDLQLQVREWRPFEDDVLLLLTDGAYNRLNFDEIKYIIDKKALGLGEKINEMFTLVNNRGNKDNQSALVLQF